MIPVLLLVIPMSQVPLDIYTPSLPQMVIDLQSSPAAMQNTVTAYMLGLAVGFIPVGMLADAFGRRPVLLTCLGIVAATSVLCAVTTDVVLLLSVRFVQGLAACACMVIAYAVAADCFRGARLTSVSGILGAAWGLAPVVAPAVGGLLVQYISWRAVFVLLGALAVVVAAVVAALLPETLAVNGRTPLAIGPTRSAVAAAISDPLFRCFVLVFGLMAAAQLSFGVVGPFLYQDRLGFSPATYGLVALAVGAANLAGELACGYFAVRMSMVRLAFSALAVFATGALILVVSSATVGANAVALTVGAALALAGCGVLCPQMYGEALGRFAKNLGLVGGIISAGCYLMVSVVLAGVGAVPEHDQGPLGWMYVAIGLVVAALLAWAMSQHRRMPSITEN